MAEAVARLTIEIDASALDPLVEIAADLDDLLDLIPERHAQRRDEIAEQLRQRLGAVMGSIRSRRG